MECCKSFQRLGWLEATLAAYKLKDYKVDVCFTSLLVRAIETTVICLTENEEICGGKNPVIKHNLDNPNGTDGVNMRDKLLKNCLYSPLCL